MAKVTREMVEKAGVDVNHLIDLLVKNASAELTTFYYYTILRLNLIDLPGEGVRRLQRLPGLRTGTTLRHSCRGFMS